MEDEDWQIVLTTHAVAHTCQDLHKYLTHVVVLKGVTKGELPNCEVIVNVLRSFSIPWPRVRHTTEIKPMGSLLKPKNPRGSLAEVQEANGIPVRSKSFDSMDSKEKSPLPCDGDRVPSWPSHDENPGPTSLGMSTGSWHASFHTCSHYTISSNYINTLPFAQVCLRRASRLQVDSKQMTLRVEQECLLWEVPSRI